MTLLNQGRSGSALLDQLTAEALERRRIYRPRPAPVIAKRFMPEPKIEEPPRPPPPPRVRSVVVGQNSELKGVSRERHGQWIARLKDKKNKTIFRGTFDTPEEAHEAYVAAKNAIPGGTRVYVGQRKVFNRPRNYQPKPVIEPVVPPKMVDIQRAVAQHFGVDRASLIGESRKISVVRVRQIAMYLCKILTKRSLPEIGVIFGWKDHTTVLHAVRSVADVIDGTHTNHKPQRRERISDATLVDDIAAVKEMLGVGK